MLIINGWLSGEEKRDGLAKILFSIDILTKFTDKFWKIFANELNMVFGYDVFESHSKKRILIKIYAISPALLVGLRHS